MKGGSTIQNLADLQTLMEKAQEEITTAQKKKIPVSRRCKTFLHFTDMSTAFDSI